MPQNFGLLIGTRADAEARVKASVCLPNSYTIRETKWQDRTTYEFTDSEIVEGRPAMRQEGGIRCVSRDLKLIRRWEGAPIPQQMDSPFFVEEKDIMGHSFQFHPIKPQLQFIKSERTGDTT